MARLEGSLARSFEFVGAITTTAPPSGRAPLRLAHSGGLQGPAKYQELERRRRRAQIAARRALDLLDVVESATESE